MSMLKKLTDFAKSDQAKEFAEKAAAKAKAIASDPETREKIDAAKKKITDRVGGGADKPAATPDAPQPPATTPGAMSPSAAATPDAPDAPDGEDTASGDKAA